MRLARRQTSGSDEKSRSRGRTSIDAGAAVQIDSALAGSEHAFQQRHGGGQMLRQRHLIEIGDSDAPEIYPGFLTRPQNLRNRDAIVGQVLVALQAYHGRYAQGTQERDVAGIDISAYPQP